MRGVFASAGAPEKGALSVRRASLFLVTASSEPRRQMATARAADSRALQTRISQRDPLAKLLERQHGVLSRAQAIELGVAIGTIQDRIRPSGPWQRLFPGVYQTERGTPTVDQLDMAALLYAGSKSLLTGRAALRRYGILPRAAGIIDVLVPATSRPADRSYVRFHRTTRMPGKFMTQGAIRFTTIPRAVTDAALGAASARDMRAIVAVGIDHGRCTPEDLAAELGHSRLRNGAMLRSVIADVTRGIRSAPEGDLMDLVDRSGLPPAVYNPTLYIGDVFLAKPDAWWEAVGVAAEVDSREYHFAEADWESTMQRHARMTAAGIRVLHFTPRRIRAEPDKVIATIRATLATGEPIAGLRTVVSA
jgi:hypothetical protein